MSNLKRIVHLRVYKSNSKDKTVSYDANGKIKSENQLVKLIHNTIEWANYLKHLRVNGFIKVDVEKVLIPKGKDTEKVEDFKDITSEVEKAFNPKDDKPLTPEQKQIAELQAKIDALTNNGKKEETKDDKQEVSEELKAAREEYKKVFNKKGHHTWTVEQIKEKISEHQAKE